MPLRHALLFAGASLLVAGLASVAIGAAGATHVQVDVSRAPGPQNEANVVIDPRSPSVLLATSHNADFAACGIRAYSSVDAGRTWTSVLLPAPPGDRKAHRVGTGARSHAYCADANNWGAIGPDGWEYVAYVAGDVTAPHAGGSGTLGWSVFVSSRPGESGRWSVPRRADRSLTTTGQGGTGFDDKPVIVADSVPGSPHRGRVYLAWTRWTGSPAVIASPSSGWPAAIEVAHSDDHGRTWSKPVPLGKGGGWGVQLAPASGGVLYASWWSGPHLLITRSTDGGETFERPRAFASTQIYPFLLNGSGSVSAEPTEPVNPNPSMDLDRSHSRYAGRIYNAYSLPSLRGRLVHLVVLDPAAHRLLSRAFSVPGGSRDEFDPTVAVDQSDGTVWLCFYLTGTGGRRVQATYSCTHSHDGGFHWTTLVSAASVPSDETRPGAFNNGLASEYASYNGLAVADGVAHPIWTDTRRLTQLREEIYTTALR